jgi:drug/metabolite transporter (DMT)-like permease
VSPTIVAAVLFAACMNVMWNVVVKTSGDPLRTTVRSLGAAMAVVTPVVAVAWVADDMPSMSAHGWGLALLSGVAELVFYVSLSAGYRRGDLSTVYPIARGTAAFGTVVVGIVLLGERLDPLAFLGVVCLLAGGWSVRRPAIRAGSNAVPWALLTGAMIVCYSAIDRVGAREGPSWIYGWAVWMAGFVMLVAWLAADRRLGITRRVERLAARRDGSLVARMSARPGSSVTSGAAPATGASIDVAATRGTADPDPRVGSPVDDAPAPWLRSTVAGLLIVGAYFIILAAYAVAPLSIVSPLRESAVVLATAWGILGLGEREGAAQRLGGAALIAAGAALVVLG